MFSLKAPGMIHNITFFPPIFFHAHCDFGTKGLVICVEKFGVNIPNTLGEINENVAWILENSFLPLVTGYNIYVYVQQHFSWCDHMVF